MSFTDRDDEKYFSQIKMERNRIIQLSTKDNVLLYISYYLKFLCFDCCWSKKRKLQKMFDDGTQKIENHFDVIKIVKSLKKLKILMENSFLTEDVKK